MKACPGAYVPFLRLTFTIAAGYYLLAVLGLGLAASPPATACPFWPSAGWALSFVLYCGPRALPGVFLGAVLANGLGLVIGLLLGQQSPLVFSALALLRATGAVLPDLFLLLWIGRARRLQKFLRELSLRAFVLPVLACCLLAAVVGIGSGCALGVDPWEQFPALAFVWWMGDALGALVVQPLLLPLLPLLNRFLGLEAVDTDPSFLRTRGLWIKAAKTLGIVVLCGGLLWLRCPFVYAWVMLLLAFVCFRIGPTWCVATALAVCLEATLRSSMLTAEESPLPHALLHFHWGGFDRIDLGHGFLLVLFLLPAALASLLFRREAVQSHYELAAATRTGSVAPVGFVWFGLDGGCRYANEEARRILNVPPGANVLGQHWAQGISVDWRDGQLRQLAKWTADSPASRAETYDTAFRVGEGEGGYYARLQLRAVHYPEGEVELFVGVVEKVDRDSSLNTLRAGFMALHHDAQNALGALVLRLVEVQEHAPGAGEALLLAEGLQVHVDRITSMVREPAQGEPPQELRVDYACHERFSRASVNQERRPQFDLQLDPGMSRWLCLRRDVFNNVMNTVLENAVKHCRGAVTVKTWLESTAGKGRLFCVAVWDDGEKLSPDKAREIAERLRECEAVCKSQGDQAPGQRNGLVNAQQLLRSIGQELKVLESPNGTWNRFEFTLPVMGSVAGGNGEPAVKSVLVLGPRAALGADLESVTTDLRKCLELTYAEAPEEARALLAAGPWAMILTAAESLPRFQQLLDGAGSADTLNPASVVLVGPAGPNSPVPALTANGRFLSTVQPCHLKPLLYRICHRMRVPKWMRRALPATQELRQRLRGERILLVEDNDEQRGEVQRNLSRCGASVVVSVRTCAQAMEELTRGTYSLILLDLKLEDGSGIDLARHIRRDLPRPPHAPVPLLVSVSAAGCLANTEDFDACLSKDFTPAQLADVLSRRGAHQAPASAPGVALAFREVPGFTFDFSRLRSVSDGKVVPETLFDVVKRCAGPTKVLETLRNGAGANLVSEALHLLNTLASTIRCPQLEVALTAAAKRGHVTDADLQLLKNFMEQLIQAFPGQSNGPLNGSPHH